MTATDQDITEGNKQDAQEFEGLQTPFKRFLSDFCESKLAVLGFLVIVGIVLLAIFAPLLTPTDPYDLTSVTILDSRLAPGEKMMSGTVAYLGTDGAGRDMVSAMIYGLRISLGVGIGSGIIAMLIGISFGLLSAYAGGRIDALFMRIVDIQLSFPAILVALVLLVTLGKGVDKTLIALVVVQWAYYARTIRGTALVERRRVYRVGSVSRIIKKSNYVSPFIA